MKIHDKRREKINHLRGSVYFFKQFRLYLLQVIMIEFLLNNHSNIKS